MAVAAAVDDGSLLRAWDEPIQRFVEDHLRASWLTPVVRGVTNLGATIPVLAVALVVAWWTWDRWPALAATAVVAAVAESFVEAGLKGLIERPRPDLDPIDAAPGFSQPSGHVFGAMVAWALVPLAVAHLTPNHRWRRAALVASTAVVVAVAFSRVYLGVHWFTDVVITPLAALAYLAVVYALLSRIWPLDPAPPAQPSR